MFYIIFIHAFTITNEGIAILISILAVIVTITGGAIWWLSNSFSKKANKSEVNQKFESMDNALSVTQHQFDCAEERQEKKFDKIDKKLDKIINWMIDTKNKN